MKKISLFITIIFLLSIISAACTITLDKESYTAGETATAAMSCSTNPEKNTAYTVNWTNQSGYQFELDSGTTPNTINQLFYETYTIPSTWPDGIWLNASFHGAGLTILQNDSANVSAAGGTNTLQITNTTFGGGYLGLVSSVKAVITDENGKRISGGTCKVSGLSNDETRVLLYQTTPMFNGNIEVSDIMPVTRFDEATEYAYKIDCYCGNAVSGTECVDEDGININNSVGTAKNFFTTNTWLTVNTVTDKSNYKMKNEIFICVNVTNVNYSKRISIPIHYEARCSSEIDNDNDLDRILIIDDGPNTIDERGISTNTTQMQCKKFIIPELNYLEGKTSECYASTKVEVLNSMNEPILSYHTTSPIFNITSTELNLDPDWQWISDSKINSIVNLSDFTDINGTGTGEIDIRLTDSINNRIYMKDSLDIFNIISNISVYNTTNLLTEHTNYELEFLEDGEIEIEIRNVSLTKTGTEWYNITLEFYDNDLRQTQALEGINNKTGTFHLDVDCPTEGTVGNDMDCIITAYVENSQLTQKEVDFTCYISDGNSQYSSTNFNQMITRTVASITKSFAVPSSFNSGQQYVLQCHADYYNLGSRRDSFYDTFVASISGGGPSGITGGVVGEEEGEKEKKAGEEEKGIAEIIKKFNPFSPERNWAFIFIEGIILIGITILIILTIKKRKKKKIPSHKAKKEFDSKAFKKTLLILAGIVILISIIAGIIYLVSYFSNLSAVSEPTSVIPEDYSIIHDKLFRGIILTAFIVLFIIILFKILNIRGEIKFGTENIFRKYDKKMKVQRKLNKEMLKHELRSIKKKK